MRWYHYVAYFFGGAFLANAVPHLVNGISGNPFQSPFASPPGEGLSSSTVNVLWGFFNLAVGYLWIPLSARPRSRLRFTIVRGAGSELRRRCSRRPLLLTQVTYQVPSYCVPVPAIVTCDPTGWPSGS